jgi:hypothetical protein
VWIPCEAVLGREQSLLRRSVLRLL